MGAVAGIWFHGWMIAIVVAVAMIINLIAAGFAGIMVPLALDRVGADPAISAAVFVTTVTDVTGFFVFLGLATWVLSV
jgi:magnesium transporter